MDILLSRLRDFSSRSSTFNDCNSAGTTVCKRQHPQARFSEAEKGDSTHTADIQSALAWLRKELMEMRSLDQLLIKQLMELHACIQELKVEYNDFNDTDSESDLSMGSSFSSYQYCFASPFSSTATMCHLSRNRNSCRRSSMP